MSSYMYRHKVYVQMSENEIISNCKYPILQICKKQWICSRINKHNQKEHKYMYIALIVCMHRCV